MYAFTFERPASTADAASWRPQGGKLLAGGQTLLASMKLRLAKPEQVVTWAALPSWPACRDGNSVVIGAMTRHADVAKNAEVKAAIPALADLANGIGDRQVRAMGTLGGSVANNDPRPAIPAPCWAWAPRCTPTSARSRRMTFSRACSPPRWKTARSSPPSAFPRPKRAAYMKFKQPASRFCADRRVCGADRQRRARGRHRRRQWRVPPPGWKTRCQRASRPRPRPP
jgi:carbon-monoxide dehydrogenase medium subunit